MKKVDMATGGVRLPYVDILKGIAIVLVVVGHVFGFFVPYHDGMGSVVHRVIYSFHMPLFMALAGYVARLVFCGSLWAELLKKGRTLMLPWVCMSTAYVLLQYGTEDSSVLLSMEARKGYWFLVTLFAIHCVVIIINVVMNWMTEVTELKVVVAYVAVMGAMFYVVPKYVHDASLCNLHRMMLYFLFGWALRNVYVFTVSMKNDLVVFIALFVYLLLIVAPVQIGVAGYVKGMTAIFFIVAMGMRLYENEIDAKGTVAGRMMTYLGRKSLAIYVLHYFFFIGMPSLDSVLFTTSNFAVSFSSALAVSVIVIVFVLMAERLISQNKYLKLFCMGQIK